MLEIPNPIPLKVGDRFILREVGRQAVVAGGRVLDPRPPRRVAPMLGRLADLTPVPDADSAAQVLLELRGIEEAGALAADTGGGRPAGSVSIGTRLASEQHTADLYSKARAALEGYHVANPLRAGLPGAELGDLLDVAPDQLGSLLQLWPDITADGSTVRLTSFLPTLDDEAGAEWQRVKEALESAALAPPRLKELDVDGEVLHSLLREGRLIRVSDDFVYLPGSLEQLEAQVRAMDDGFTVAGFRDELGITRKHAVPLLEWLDGRGVTARQGDVRVVRRKPSA